ncbi:MAG TPA: sensor domain-containing diguanylate cyclase [Anaerolineales bacterium]|nr:sensor domain-containing diguanylate cyclase [Anaerolineales bacterium]
MDNSDKKFVDYIPGFLMGLSLPAISVLSILLVQEMPFSLDVLIRIHQRSPFIWLIDLAPFLTAYLVSQTRQRKRLMEEYAAIIKKGVEEKALYIKNEHSFFEALITNSPFAVVQLDNDHQIISFNPAFEALFEFQGKDIIGKHLDALVVPGDYYQEAAEITQTVKDGTFFKGTSQRMKSDGSLFYVEIIGIPVFSGGERIGVMGIYNDINAQKKTEKDLQLSEKRFRSLFYNSPVSLWEEDFSAVKTHLDEMARQGVDVVSHLQSNPTLVRDCVPLVKILDVNQATLDMYHAKTKEELLAGLSTVLAEESLQSFQQELIALSTGKKNFECEIVQKKMDGTRLYGLLRLSLSPGAEETWDKVLISIVDITERKEAEEKLRYVSFHDALTGLYNRAYFEEEMSRLNESRKFPVTIFSCDLDNLKGINDSLGHDVGDQALKAAAKVLENVFRNEDVVARIGGDEFAVILPYVSEQIGIKVSERISNEIERFNQDDNTVGLYRPISLSFGSAMVPMGMSLFEGYKKADEQMYFNKLEKKRK